LVTHVAIAADETVEQLFIPIALRDFLAIEYHSISQVSDAQKELRIIAVGCLCFCSTGSSMIGGFHELDGLNSTISCTGYLTICTKTDVQLSPITSKRKQSFETCKSFEALIVCLAR
jgi:hypothetical protein